MAIESEFNGKRYIEPTIEAAIKNGIPIQSQSTYGRILFPDLGEGATWGGGKGTIPVTNTQATHSGTANLSAGHDWSSTNAQDFNINVNGAGVLNITLTANCGTLVAVIAHVNTRLYAAGILTAYAFDAGSNHIGIRTIIGGTGASMIITTGSVNALGTLGWTAATYIGMSSTGNSRMLQDFIYNFDDLQTLQTFLKGGIMWDLANYLYNPTDGVQGANRTIFIKPIEGSQATSSMFFANGKCLTIKTFDEGVIGNGQLDSLKLYKGYGWKLVTGTKDITKFKIQFYLGSYKGTDSNGYQYDARTQSAASDAPKLLFESIEFINFVDFINWSVTSSAFKAYFEIDITKTDMLGGTIVSADVTRFAGMNVFVGGTESYSSNALSIMLSELVEYDYTFILSTKSGDNGWATENISIVDYITNTRIGAKPFLQIGGHDTKDLRGNSLSSDSTTSTGIAIKHNSVYAEIYHGGDNAVDVVNPLVLRPLSAIYLAAKCTGRRAGLQPMDSLTYKTIKSYKPQDIINNKNIDADGNIGREDLIQLGVIFMREVDGIGNVIDLDINSLQGDQNKVYQTVDSSDNAISYQSNSMQIKQDLIRQTINYFKPKIIGKRSNEITISALLTMYATFMSDRVLDGLIVSFRNLSIVQKGTAYFFFGEYKEPTTIEKAFFTYSATI